MNKEEIAPAVGVIVVALVILALLVKFLGGLGIVLAIVIAVVVFLRLLPADITGWKR
ncbi:MAG TPA: hypothetical protein VLK89_07180 [Solirubrobacterales bacterium]|nr:hypothetical protein [Solirubrobacterales bacterium]